MRFVSRVIFFVFRLGVDIECFILSCLGLVFPLVFHAASRVSLLLNYTTCIFMVLPNKTIV